MKTENVLIAIFCTLALMLLWIIGLRASAGSSEAAAPAVDTAGLKQIEIIQAPEPTATPEPEQQECSEEPAAPVRTSSDIPLSVELQQVLRNACDANGIEYAIALALIQTESNFDPYVVSYSGCYGLCQLNPYYFPAGLSAAENIEYGIRYLGQNLAKYGDIGAALCAYNEGHDSGNRGYANLIISRAAAWREIT